MANARDRKQLPEQYQNWLDLKEATEALGFKYTQYTRRLVREGKLEAVKVKMSFGPKIFVNPAAVEKYKATPRTRVGASGIRRVMVKVGGDSDKAIEVIKAALKEAGYESAEVGYAYKGGSKSKKKGGKSKQEEEDYTATIIERLSPDSPKAKAVLAKGKGKGNPLQK